MHIGHLKDKTERIERVDVPIVTHLKHVILKIYVVVRVRIVLEQRCLAVTFKIDIIIRIDLRQLPESIRFFSPIIKHKREHFLTQPTVDIREIHASITGRKHSVQTAHHIAFGLDIDDTSLTGSVVFGGRIRDDFDLLNRIAVCSIEHRFELLAA